MDEDEALSARQKARKMQKLVKHATHEGKSLAIPQLVWANGSNSSHLFTPVFH